MTMTPQQMVELLGSAYARVWAIQARASMPAESNPALAKVAEAAAADIAAVKAALTPSGAAALRREDAPDGTRAALEKLRDEFKASASERLDRRDSERATHRAGVSERLEGEARVFTQCAAKLSALLAASPAPAPTTLCECGHTLNRHYFPGCIARLDGTEHGPLCQCQAFAPAPSDDGGPR